MPDSTLRTGTKVPSELKRLQPLPEKIGKYTHISRLAEGGMGAVYKGYDPELKRWVVIKKLKVSKAGKNLRTRFTREAAILSELTSQRIVRFFETISEDGSEYFVLEYVEGMSLDKLLEKDHTLPAPLALWFLKEACLGLHHAHVKNIVHRDIKPGNILIAKGANIKLADFGISGLAADESDAPQPDNDKIKKISSAKIIQQQITQTNVALGTPSYMAPEQIYDSSSVDQRADIYALGIMLYEMITGKKPFEGNSLQERYAVIKKGKYKKASSETPGTPSVVNRLIKKMIAFDPDKRFSSVEEISNIAESYLKQYNEKDIRQQLANSMARSGAYNYKELVKPNSRRNKAIAIICALGIAGGLGYYAYKEGYIHRTILRPWYTPVTLHLDMPTARSQDADLPSRAFFYKNDNDQIPELENCRRVFEIKNSSDHDAEFRTADIRPVYLKPGEYRVKIATGPYVWWSSFTVGKTAIDAHLNHLMNTSRKITFNTAAVDVQTGKDITANCRFQIETAKGLQDISAVKGNLSSGQVCRIHVTCDGYEEEYFGLLIDWYQDEVFINAAMRKK
ncbi:MAG TPA: serine/threonine protein kinase [Treponema sp.]|jgi:serine/threonine-protein kinase|nr:serine/threonine protein kinase [Treponema sp.]